MQKALRSAYRSFGTSFFHPQWVINRIHRASQAVVAKLSGMTILDIGSGDSSLYKMLESENRVFRLDYPVTNRNYAHLPDIYADAHNLPIADNSADVVLVFEVLEHVTNPADVCAELARVLRNRGKLYLSTPFLYPIHDAPHDYQRLTIHGLRHLLNQQNLEVIEEKQHGNSFLAVLQLFNLSLLELVRRSFALNEAVGIFVGLVFYPAMILANLFAIPLLKCASPDAACLGYFIVARKN